MLKKRNAQGLSITTIIVAVIGLIVLIVLVAVFTGRIGSFSKGIEEANTCASVCDSLGMNIQKNQIGTGTDANSCGNPTTEKLIGGSFGDITWADGVCCCKP